MALHWYIPSTQNVPVYVLNIRIQRGYTWVHTHSSFLDPSALPPTHVSLLHPSTERPKAWTTSQLCSVPPAAAQRTDLGGEAAGVSINHSQMLLHRLQELLRQGNASDVVLRVQATGTDEVRVFHSHRLLLGLHSELFRELLSNQSEVVLQEPRDCAAVFDKFVR